MAQGPVKKAGSGPSLSTQFSTNSQQQVLQHQTSSDTKDDSEGDNCKNWKQQVLLDVPVHEHRSCCCLSRQIQSYSMCQHAKCLCHNTVLTACLPFLSSCTVRTSWSPPKNHAADQRCRKNYCHCFLLWKSWICSLKSGFASLPFSGYWQVSGVEFQMRTSGQRPQEFRVRSTHNG